MRTERQGAESGSFTKTGRLRRWGVLGAAAAALLGLVGCVGGSVGPDLREVAGLSGVARIGGARASEAEEGPSAEALAILREPLDVEGAVRVALLENRGLRAELEGLGALRGRWVQASLPDNPVVEVELLPERDASVELRVEQDVTSLLLAPVRARAAEAEMEAGRLRAASEVLRVGHGVRVAFFEMLAAEKKLALAKRALETFGAARDLAEALAAAGNVPALEAAAEVAAHEKAKVAVAELELAAADRREALAPRMGLSGRHLAWRARGELPEVPESLPGLEGLEGKAVAASLELRAARADVEGLARRAGAARAEGWAPDVAVDVHALRVTGAESGSLGLARSPEEWRVGGGVSVTIPVFDRGQGTARALDAEGAAAREREAGAAIALRAEVRRAKNRLVSAHARARRYREVVIPAQQRVIEETLLQYNAMQVGLGALLAAKRERMEMEMDEVEATAEYWGARVTLDALLAGCLVSEGGGAGAAGAGGAGARGAMSMGAAESARGGH